VAASPAPDAASAPNAPANAPTPVADVNAITDVRPAFTNAYKMDATLAASLSEQDVIRFGNQDLSTISQALSGSKAAPGFLVMLVNDLSQQYDPEATTQSPDLMKAVSDVLSHIPPSLLTMEQPSPGRLDRLRAALRLRQRSPGRLSNKLRTMLRLKPRAPRQPGQPGKIRSALQRMLPMLRRSEVVPGNGPQLNAEGVEFGLDIMKVAPWAYPLLPDAMKADPTIAAFAASHTNWGSPNFDAKLLHASVLSNPDFLLEQTKNNPYLYTVGSEFCSDVKTMIALVTERPEANIFATKDVKADPTYQAALKASLLKHVGSFKMTEFSSGLLPPELFKDKDVMKAVIKNNAVRYMHVDPSLANDPGIIAALKLAIRGQRMSDLSTLTPKELTFPDSVTKNLRLACLIAERGGYALLPKEAQLNPRVAITYAKANLPDLDHPDPNYVATLKQIVDLAAKDPDYGALLKNPTFVQQCIVSDPLSLQYLANEPADPLCLGRDTAILRTAVDLNGLALQYVPQDLRSPNADPELRPIDSPRITVQWAVRRDGDALQFAGADFQKDPEITKASMDESLSWPEGFPQRGTAIQYVSPDAPNYLTLLTRAGRAIEAGVGLPDNADNPWQTRKPADLLNDLKAGLDREHSGWNTRPEDVLALLKQGAALSVVLDATKGGASASMWNDIAFTKKVVDLVGPDALPFLPKDIAARADVQATAIGSEAMQTTYQLPQAMQDFLTQPSVVAPDGKPFETEKAITKVLQLAHAMVKQNHWLYYSLPETSTVTVDGKTTQFSIPADPTIVSEALQHDERLAQGIPTELQNNLPQLAVLLRANPRAQEYILPQRLEAIFAMTESEFPGITQLKRQLVESRRAYERDLKELHLDPTQFNGETQLLERVRYEMRNNVRGQSGEVGAIYQGEGNWDGARFTDALSLLLKRGLRPRYFPINTVGDLVRAMQYQASLQKPKIAYIDGHGSYNAVALGSNDSSVWDIWSKTTRALTLRYKRLLQNANIRDLLGSTVVLGSCETGRFIGASETVYREDVASMLSDAATKQLIYSPAVSVPFTDQNFPGYGADVGTFRKLGPTQTENWH
jgi:hypothetical protein